MGRLLPFSHYYKPFPRQKEFHESAAKYRLFGGAAGPGKTKALLWEAIMQALQAPGSDSLLLRRTFPELESSLLLQFRRDVPRSPSPKNATMPCASPKEAAPGAVSAVPPNGS
jgi:phage terminase large subunit